MMTNYSTPDPQHHGETQPLHESKNSTPVIPADQRIAQALSLVELAFEALALGQDVGELLTGIKKHLDEISRNYSLNR